MATGKYQGIKYQDNEARTVEDALSVEEALQIIVNEVVFTLTMRTPGDDLELVRGLLHSESILNSPDFHPSITFVKEESEDVFTKAFVEVPNDYLQEDKLNARNLLSVSACGICGKTELENITASGESISASSVFNVLQLKALFHRMNEFQRTFQKSGGSHAAACYDTHGNMLSLREDIGRHNAVDKVIGDLIMSHNYRKANVLLVSGRISYEIVVKAFKARIPVLCAVSAPSSLAVDFAKELGITLLAFCREDRATCYAHPERIVNEYIGQKAG